MMRRYFSVAAVALVAGCVSSTPSIDAGPSGPRCGNAILEPPEKCDTAIAAGQFGACPVACDDKVACTKDTLQGTGCEATCVFTPITQCTGQTKDGCCPSGCNANSDADCSPTCGNGALEQGEACDTAIAAGQAGACPTSCDDKNACTTDNLLNGGSCSAACSNTPVTQCSGQTKDGCCPAGCNATTDADCSTTCGNGVLEPPEKCDTAIAAGQPGACPASAAACDDKNACTVDTLLNGNTCGALCSNTPISQCSGQHKDGCCPGGCTAVTDADCSPTCGNGVLETQEQCDTAVATGPGACPPSAAACDDKNACTQDTLLNGGTCGAVCSNTPVSQCSGQTKDGCCPTACNATSDADCSPSCGNGTLEAGESCDTGIATGQPGSCPLDAAACDDKNACTTDSLLNANSCGAVCSHTPVTQCSGQHKDGCCPTGCNAVTDADCSPSCGNGTLEAGEKCDTAIAAGQPGACPASLAACDDKNACTADSLLSGGTCGAVCSNVPITQCSGTTKDGCCPTGCTANSDADCSPSCGNSTLESGESCDTGIAAGQPGACPMACNDNVACTKDTLLNGNTCGAVCSHTPISQCSGQHKDGCCPTGCDAVTDADCSPTCNNGVLEGQEKCDPAIAAGTPGACPTSCNDNKQCTTDTLLNGGTCDAVCVNAPITTCSPIKDGCCPTTCNATNDADCLPICGNGVLEAGEQCDTGIAAGNIGACPSSCNDGNVCTKDTLLSPATCGASCSFTPIVQCVGADGCCPAGCNANNDGDCAAVCGNKVVEAGEKCDIGIAPASPGACPTSCDDKNACTTDTLIDGGTCGAACSNTAITACIHGDGCCAPGCNANNDNDCPPKCGNGVVEAGETCDKGLPGSCPTACNDNVACTKDTLLNAGTCTASCSFTPINQCINNDGCCPIGCNANNDNNCSPICGNGVVEAGETCDTSIAAGQPGACPTSCNDGQACTTDTLLDAGTCKTVCTFLPTSAPCWVKVNPGTFTMGSPSTEPCREFDGQTRETQHTVTLTKAFLLQAYETTQGEFKSIMGYNPSANPGCGATCPVQTVSKNEATAYCNQLSINNGLPPCYTCTGVAPNVSCSVVAAYSGSGIYSCPGYRLPTEAEWEYAYRAGTTTAYYNGANDAAQCQGSDANAGVIGWYRSNSANSIHPVGQKAPNAWGLYDMAGNVSEIVHDEFQFDLGSQPVTDPVSTATGSETCYRGGSYMNYGGVSGGDPRDLRAAIRDRASVATFQLTNAGFRCARTAP